MTSLDDWATGRPRWIAAINGKFFPLHGMFQPYLLVGGGYGSVKDERASSPRDTAGASFQFAGGIDVYVHRNIALFAQAGYLLHTGNRSDYGSIPITFGVTYRFF